MKFPAYIFPSDKADKARLELDSGDKTEPSKIYSGPYKGMMFLDADLALRNPDWRPLFIPLIADPANQVQLVELTTEETTPINLQ